jgi:hypothetical protein
MLGKSERKKLVPWIRSKKSYTHEYFHATSQPALGRPREYKKNLPPPAEAGDGRSLVIV